MVGVKRSVMTVGSPAFGGSNESESSPVNPPTRIGGASGTLEPLTNGEIRTVGRTWFRVSGFGFRA
jgi:hypothetical protein